MGTANKLIPRYENCKFLWEGKLGQGDTSKLHDVSTRIQNAPMTGTKSLVGDTVLFGGGVATIPNIPRPTESTVVIKCYPTSSSLRRNVFNGAYGGHGTWTFEISGEWSSYVGTSGGNATPYTKYGTGTITQNAWNILGTTRTLSQLKKFKNASLESTTANPYGDLGTDNQSVLIGDGYVDPFLGNVAFIGIWDAALTDEEMIELQETLVNKTHAIV